MSTTKIDVTRQGSFSDDTSIGHKLTSVTDPSDAQDAATKNYVDGLLGANDAMTYKGVIDASSNPNYPEADAGDTYKISVAGKVGGASGAVVQVGDMIVCTDDGSAGGTQAEVGSEWNIIQANIDGAVTGPASSVDNNFATFNSTSGKVIKDSGLSLDTDDTLAADSDSRIPTQQAVKGYVDTEIAGAATGLVDADFVVRETPTGLVNGSNTSYELANTPTAGTEEVYLNGLLQEPGAGNDYTISGDTITYLTAPLTGDRLRVSYRK